MSFASQGEATLDGLQNLATTLESTLVSLPRVILQRWSSLAFVEQMFTILRLLTIPGVLGWLWFNPYRAQLFDGIGSLLIFFAIYSSVVLVATFTLPPERLKRFQFLEILCDFVFITLLLNETGSVGIIFQSGYIILIIFASYYFKLVPALLLVAVTFVLTLILGASNRIDVYWGDIAILAAFEVLVAVGVGMIARRDRQEKERIEKLNRELQLKTAELMRAYRGILASWAAAVDAKDTYTRGHAERVSRLARAIAESMDLPSEESDRIAIAALLHDVGKLAVPDAILGKPAGLTAAEILIVRQHVSAGAEMIAGVELLSDLAPLIEFHHERADGSGYPRGVRLDDIPLGARIVAVADAYDAMTSERIYRPALSHAEAIAELTANSCKGFDPEVVSAFLSVTDQQPRTDHGLRVATLAGTLSLF